MTPTWCKTRIFFRYCIHRGLNCLSQNNFSNRPNSHGYTSNYQRGGTKKQTNKLEHTQTNSQSMHFICENTNWYVIRTCNFLTFFRKNKLVYDKNMSFCHLPEVKGYRAIYLGHYPTSNQTPNQVPISIEIGI